MRGSWNSDENFEYITDPEAFLAMDGGDGSSSVKLSRGEKSALTAMAKRTRSDPEFNPVTGVGLGKDPATMPKTPKVRKEAKAPTKRAK